MPALCGMPAPSHKLWKVTQAQRTGPVWSMYTRREIKGRGNDTPSPNVYVLPSALSQRSFTLSKRLPSEAEMSDRSVPGPKYMPKPVVCIRVTTLKSRPQSAPSSRGIPGPAKYYPKFNPGKFKRSPSFTLKSRVSFGDPMGPASKTSPGPAAYMLPSTVTDVRPISLKGRVFMKTNADRTPAPNCYRPTRGARPASSRAYTIAFRRDMKDKSRDTPGPIYDPLKPMGFQKVRSWSSKSRARPASAMPARRGSATPEPSTKSHSLKRSQSAKGPRTRVAAADPVTAPPPVVPIEE